MYVTRRSYQGIDRYRNPRYHHPQRIYTKMPSSMETLTSKLNYNVQKLTGYLETTSHPQPSFQHDSPPTTLPKNAPDEIQQTREQIMNTALSIFHLAAGPSEFLVNLSTSVSLHLPLPIQYRKLINQVPLHSLPKLANNIQHLHPYPTK